ncbi:hypothetical protein FZC33_15995 [Labrys sp. KNU-23]|uniref:hypothetical protein n=1 Tax=Labrys sp. KNU-23 TaxID=2789216 RepID=UPI0011ED9B08|nr:hypothetical protein [Labrys sp. KNU-23]QEN87725.1 hypothetical protein FZC33_15995 [Labrys sp. KNU-23]
MKSDKPNRPRRVPPRPQWSHFKSGWSGPHQPLGEINNVRTELDLFSAPHSLDPIWAGVEEALIWTASEFRWLETEKNSAPLSGDVRSNLKQIANDCEKLINSLQIMDDITLEVLLYRQMPTHSDLEEKEWNEKEYEKRKEAEIEFKREFGNGGLRDVERLFSILGIEAQKPQDIQLAIEDYYDRLRLLSALLPVESLGRLARTAIVSLDAETRLAKGRLGAPVTRAYGLPKDRLADRCAQIICDYIGLRGIKRISGTYEPSGRTNKPSFARLVRAVFTYATNKPVDPGNGGSYLERSIKKTAKKWRKIAAEADPTFD